MFKSHHQDCPGEPLAYSSEEACRQLGGISKRSLRRLELQGKITSVKGLRHKTWKHEDLVAYLDNNK
jgi:hypothetical protein